MSNVIDMETYFYPQRLLEFFSNRIDYPVWDKEQNQLKLSDTCVLNNQIYMSKMQESFSLRIKQMDECGIEKAILCVEQGLQTLKKEEKDDIIAQVKLLNDAIYSTMQAYPERFLGVAVIQSQDIEQAVLELEHCVKDYGFVGCQILSDYGNMLPDDEAFYPIFEKACELDIPIFMHSVIPQMGRILEFGPQMYELGRGNDIAIATARLIAKGVFDRYPDLKVVLGNLGEMLPFVIERMEHYAELHETKKAPAINLYSFRYYFSHNVWVTTSGICSEAVFKCVQEILGTERILFSTNYPAVRMEKMGRFIKTLDVSDEEKEKITAINANVLLNL